MTVRELIAMLEQLPPDAIVVESVADGYDGERGVDDCNGPWLLRDGRVCFGDYDDPEPPDPNRVPSEQEIALANMFNVPLTRMIFEPGTGIIAKLKKAVNP